MCGGQGPVARLGLIAMILVLGYSAGRAAILEGLPRLLDVLGVGWTGKALAALAVMMMVGGFVWIRRITSGEPDPSAWRSRYPSPVRTDTPIESGTMRPDVRRTQETARNMIAVTLVLPVLAFILWIASPGGFRGMFYEPPWYGLALPWLGAAGYLVGLGWMIRIYRARPEDGERTWRYRARR